LVLGTAVRNVFDYSRGCSTTAEAKRRYTATAAPPDRSGESTEVFWAANDAEAAKLTIEWAEAECRRNGWEKASIALADDAGTGIGMKPIDFTSF
jgi:hypothetical protein